MRRQTSVLLSCLVFGWVSLVALAPAGANDDETPRTISISATGYVDATPDIARLSIGVITEAVRARAALYENSKSFDAVLSAVKALGVAASDITTDQFAVSPIYERVKRKSVDRREISGFRVQNSAVIIIRDIAKAGSVIDRATAAGANNIGQIEFTVSKLEFKLDFAREAAMRNAIRRAKLFATAAGARLGKIQTISEQFHGGARSQPVYGRSARMAAAPIEPGQKKLGVTVLTVWALE